MARGAPRVALRPATPRRLSAAGNRLVARCLLHARWPERWAWRQVFKPRNLVAQKLVVDLQPGVLDPQLIVFFSKLSVVSLKRLNPDFYRSARATSPVTNSRSAFSDSVSACSTMGRRRFVIKEVNHDSQKIGIPRATRSAPVTVTTDFGRGLGVVPFG
ncbi:hypothetical protein K6M90_28770 [Rhizobium sp. 9T]|nr:hypothetical protein [Rhizobium croatiense]